MKKKTFIQLHLSMIISNCFLLFLIGGSIISFISPFSSFTYKNLDRRTTLIIWFFSLIVVVWIGITLNHHWITFNTDHIYVPFDWRIKRNRQQYRVEVKYEDIMDVSFIRSTKSSKNTTIQEESSKPTYHQYMVLLLKNGRKERIKIDWYSKKQKVKILEELKKRLEYCGNNIDLTQAQEILKNLGMTGPKFVLDIAEKRDQKKQEKKIKAKK